MRLVTTLALAIGLVSQFSAEVEAGHKHKHCCCCCASGSASAGAAAAAAPAAAAPGGNPLLGPPNPALANGTAGAAGAAAAGGAAGNPLLGPPNPNLANGQANNAAGQPASQTLLSQSDTSETETWKQIALLQKKLAAKDPNSAVFDLRTGELQSKGTVTAIAAANRESVLQQIATDWKLP
ncbi:hypothetical protein GC163_01050 [bacterium]|nr:hypothetical protein [bacterium]